MNQHMPSRELQAELHIVFYSPENTVPFASSYKLHADVSQVLAGDRQTKRIFERISDALLQHMPFVLL